MPSETDPELLFGAQTGRMVDLSRFIDTVLEAPIVPSFSRIGFAVRSRAEHWTRLDDYDLSGRTAVVTGATSGLGRAIAEQLARCGAGVVLWGRDRAKTERVRSEIAAATKNASLDIAISDLAEADSVRGAAAGLLASHGRLDVLVHNAGALSAERRTNAEGHEITIASQVLGPFLLTSLLLGRLRSSAVARVITMSSGGMYAAPLTVEELEMRSNYRGSEQYARAKRAQVTLNEMWAAAVPAREVVFHSVHPGWADTPGVQEALPGFRRLTRPVLRTAAEGADTTVWLAADDAALKSSGGFWHDRRRRSIHRLGSTRRSDTPQRRSELWEWCVLSTGERPSVG